MLKKRQILVAFAAAFFAFAVAPLAQAGSLSRSEASLLRAVNQTRASYGLKPVRFDVRLERAARSHSQDMLARSYFAHGAVASRFRAFGARGPIVGENLAWGEGVGARGVIRMWLASPKHRANLLRPGFRRIGIGTATGTFLGYGGATVVTADFAGR